MLEGGRYPCQGGHSRRNKRRKVRGFILPLPAIVGSVHWWWVVGGSGEGGHQDRAVTSELAGAFSPRERFCARLLFIEIGGNIIYLSPYFIVEAKRNLSNHLRCTN